MTVPPAPPTDDVIVRALTDDDTFRVMVARTTETVRGAIAAQRATGATARHFAELITSLVLVRETMSPAYRVQAILTGERGVGQLLGDSHPDGSTRGLVKLPAASRELRLGPGSLLQVMRSLATGGISRGLVDASAITSVPDAVMAYLQESEQIVSVVGMAVCMAGAEVELAGGYLVQLLPGAPPAALRAMTNRLSGLSDTELRACGGSPQAVLDALLGEQPYARLGEDAVRYHCWCNEQAVVAALASLSRDELADLARAEETLELSCDYCHANYQIAPAQLQGLLEPS
jgi:molecular chaperone Hsp33